MTHQKKSQKQSGLPLLQFAISAALATAAGYVYAAHKETIDKEARKKINQLALFFHESKAQVEKRVGEVWGDVSKEAVARYLDARGALLKALEIENLEKGGSILQDRYDHIVDSVIENIKKSHLMTPEVEKKLKELFKMDWKDISDIFLGMVMRGAQKTVRALQGSKVKRDIEKAAKGIPKKSAEKSAKKRNVKNSQKNRGMPKNKNQSKNGTK